MKFRRVTLSHGLMIALLNSAFSVRLPKDTCIANVFVDPNTMRFKFVLHSPEFEELNEAAQIPYVDKEALESLLELELDRG